MKSEIVGIIGKDGLGPMTTWNKRERNGEMVDVPFRRFSIFYEDLTKKPELNKVTGRDERPREILQVVLPENERGAKILQYCRPGRKVQVKGPIRISPRTASDRDGNVKTYANAQCYMREIEFMDSPPEAMAKRALGILVASGAIDEDTSKKHLESVNAYLASQQEPSNSTKSEDPDPDSPDFAK